MIDLHAHTTASDGRLSPRELVVRAKQAGVTVLAVTDHDTVSGLAEATAAARSVGLELVAGIEISTEIEGRDIHVLGHFVDPEHAALRAFAAAQETERRARMERMVGKLVDLGFAIAMSDVERVAGSDNLCRPHLARVLVERSIATDMQDAFTRFIGDGAPAFSSQRRVPASEAIALIHAAGGVATLAHPLADGVARGAIETLKSHGLDGLEVVRGDQVGRDRDETMALALSLGLVPTGGSDFHQDGDPLGKVGLARRFFDQLSARRGTASGTRPEPDRTGTDTSSS